MFDTLPPQTRTRIWWIRHAPVKYPVAEGALFYGGGSDWDAEICPDPQSWASIASFLPDDLLWVTSGMRRTEQTASAIQQAHKSNGGPNGSDGAWLREPAFMEQKFGDWEGKARDQINDQEWEHFWHSKHDRSAPNGETFLELIDRVRGGVQKLLMHHSGKNIVVVAHGGTIRAALSIAFAIPPRTSASFHIANNSLTKMTHYAVLNATSQNTDGKNTQDQNTQDQKTQGETNSADGGHWSLNFCNIKAHSLSKNLREPLP